MTVGNFKSVRAKRALEARLDRVEQMLFCFLESHDRLLTVEEQAFLRDYHQLLKGSFEGPAGFDGGSVVVPPDSGSTPDGSTGPLRG